MRKEVQRTSPPALKRAGRPLPWLRFSVAVVSLLLLALVTLSTPVDGAPSKDPVDECETSADGTCLSPEEATEPSPSNFLFPCNNSTLQQYLHDEAVPGFHIVCFDRFKATQTETREFLKLTYYRFGVDKKNETIVQTFPAPFNWKQIRFAMERKLDLTMKKKIGEYQPWAVFTPMGQRVVDADMDSTVDAEAEDLILQILVRYQTLLIYEGGQFLWPGVEVGFTRPVNLYSVMPLGDPELPDRHQTVVLRTLSLTPLVFSVQNFLTDPECDYIQEKAEPSLEYSGVVLMDKDKGRPASDFRTSQSTFVSSYKDELMMDIEYRTASLVRIPRKHQEDVQVLRYGLGEKYDHHHDYFDPSLYSNDPGTLSTIQNGRRNRLATVFWYLSDVEQGGETAFPRFNDMEPQSMQDCETGLLVRPEKGKVIIFYSLLPSGEADPLSLHGACPVKEGTKSAANKWVWNEEMMYLRH